MSRGNSKKKLTNASIGLRKVIQKASATDRRAFQLSTKNSLNELLNIMNFIKMYSSFAGAKNTVTIEAKTKKGYMSTSLKNGTFGSSLKVLPIPEIPNQVTYQGVVWS